MEQPRRRNAEKTDIAHGAGKIGMKANPPNNSKSSAFNVSSEVTPDAR